jgi:hypothetical protein
MRRLVLAVLSLAFVAACGEVTGPEDVAGTYTLQTVGGSPPPWLTFIFTEALTIDGEPGYADHTVEWVSGLLQLNSDATFSAKRIFRETTVFYDGWFNPIDTTVTTIPGDTHSGTFSVSGTSIQLTSADGTVNTALLSGDVLTLIVEGGDWVYER